MARGELRNSGELARALSSEQANVWFHSGLDFGSTVSMACQGQRLFPFRYDFVGLTPHL